MRRRVVLLATAGVALAGSRPFSPSDDVLAYPQYEVIFADSYIPAREASLRLSVASHLTATSRGSVSSTSSTSSSTSWQSSASSIRDPASRDVPAKIDNGPSNASPTSSNAAPSPSTTSYERMILDNTAYLCSVPPIPHPIPAESENGTNAAEAIREETAELARVTDRGTELLNPMSEQCLYFASGWWSYQFCYSQSVKQFHPLAPSPEVPAYPPVADPSTPTYILGVVNERRVNQHRLSANDRSNAAAIDAGLTRDSTDVGAATTVQAKGPHRGRFLSQKLDSGTICDLTGAPRRIEVQFHCHPQSSDRIAWIKETSTCAYLMVVYTPRLCNDVAFMPEPEEKAEEIVCHEIVDEADFPDWQRRQSAREEKFLIEHVAASATIAQAGSRPRPMVGDIEIGAMKMLNENNDVLKAPNSGATLGGNGNRDDRGNGEANPDSSAGRDPIVPQGQSLAHQHPTAEGGAVHRLTDRELKELGVDLQALEVAMADLQMDAAGRAWKVELYLENGETRMRGIIDDGRTETRQIPESNAPRDSDRGRVSGDDVETTLNKRSQENDREGFSSRKRFEDDMDNIEVILVDAEADPETASFLLQKLQNQAERQEDQIQDRDQTPKHQNGPRQENPEDDEQYEGAYYDENEQGSDEEYYHDDL